MQINNKTSKIKNIKTIRTYDNRLFIFCYDNGSVYCRSISKSQPPQSTKVMDNVSPVFSVCVVKNGIYILLCGSNNIYLCYYDFVKWVSKPLSSLPDTEFTNISFFTLENIVCLIYSIRNSDNTESLYIRSMKDGNWTFATKIDDIVPFSASSYFVSKIDNTHFAINYSMTNNTIYNRILDISNGSISEKTVVLTTKLPCIDISFLTDSNSQHILYLTQNRYSTQLIYKGINSEISSKAKIIWEGQSADNCILLNCSGRLYALVYGDRNSYITYSDNNGRSFSTIKKLNPELFYHCLKAVYYNYSENNNFNCDEVFINVNDFSFPFTDDIYPDFVPIKTVCEVKSKPIKHQYTFQSMGNDEQINNLTSQIEELSKALAKRNEEIASISARWSIKCNSLIKENNMLKNRILEMEHNNMPKLLPQKDSATELIASETDSSDEKE